MKFKMIIILPFVFILTSCLLSDYKYDLNELEEQVISAEIVKEVDVKNGMIKLNVINKISNDKLNNLLFNLSEITFRVRVGEPVMPSGNCLKLNYKDEFELVCNRVLEKYTNKYEFISRKYINKPEGFDDFILKYQELE